MNGSRTSMRTTPATVTFPSVTESAAGVVFYKRRPITSKVGRVGGGRAGVSRHAADASEGGRVVRETIRGVEMADLWATIGVR